MKATITLLTALLMTTICFNAARAQSPLQPVSFGAKAAGGGCADGNCGGGCNDGACGKGGLFGKLCHKDGCGDSGCGKKCLSWLCRPLPSNAPSCRKSDYPLGFPMHPYLRSPRDYFMVD